MQQRGVNPGMEIEPDEQIPPPQSRSRNNSKLKVLTRSHAMREETSPPRDPTPTALGSPCIKLSPSFDKRPSPSPQRPLLVLSPSASRGNSPSHTPNLSPTSTLVASPTRYSPQPHPHDTQSEFSDVDTSPKISRLNRQNVERLNTRNMHKTDIIVEESSQISKKKCECMTHTCQNCLRNQERNFNNNLSSSDNNNTLTVSRHVRGKLRQQSSSQGSFEGNSSVSSPCLSRGVDLELFIPETLNRNAKDRALMLRIEEELVHLAKDKIKTHFKFPPMSSYQRMLVHRCAAYFGMDHNIESSGKCVVVNKTKNTRIPDVEFKQHVKEDIIFSEEPRRSILKRDSNSIEDYNFKSPDRQYDLENRRSKSFEEREEEYEKVRRRIFNKEHRDYGSSADDLGWPEISWSNSDSEHLGKYRMDNVHSSRSGARLLKVQSEETGEETLRPCVAKSYSFGGYGGVLTRGDSVLSTHSAGPRLLTKQDSAASSVSWRLSPSSSGYKTQSQRSESVTPSPTSTPYLSGESARQDSTNSTTTNISDIHPDDTEPSTQVVWAVTSIDRVPKGSVIINPQTGQPVKNNDGSVYHYDPDYPLPEMQSNPQTVAKPPPSPIKSPQKVQKERPASPKRRTRGSPIKKTNSSTSPSLPFTPPPLQQVNRTFTNIGGGDNLTNLQPHQPQYPMYGPSYTPENNIPMYQPQQCIVFTPYGSSVPVPYETRMENQVQEVSGYYNMPETLQNPPSQQMTYQPPAQLWNQPAMAYYQNTQPPNIPQRYVPIPNQNTYITPYHPNYIPTQNIPQQPAVQNEVLTVYPQQSLPLMYQQPQSNPVYPNPIYSQQSPHVYPQNISYPVNTPTPNSCTSSVSNSSYLGQVFEQSIVQNMTQMTIAQNKNVPNDKKRVNCKGSSSQSSSTEASSPAMTVIAGYCHNQGLYRQGPETPPTSSYGNNNFVPPMFFRQMNNVRASPPVTSRSSRSPTPASDAHVERQRYSLPPLVYQGLPYPIQSDARLVPGRGQPTAYRTAPVRQSTVNPVADNKNYKNRRSRGSKASSLPPNGKLQ